MEADYTELCRLALPGASLRSPPSQATAFAFDPSQELLWVGNEYGRVTSFYGQELQKYTSYRAHESTAPRRAPGNAPVKQFLFCDKGVISLSQRSVHLSSRRGLTLWHLSTSEMLNLACMSFTNSGPKSSEIVIAGGQRQIYRIDVEKGIVTETIEQSKPVSYTLMRKANQHICAAGQDGSIYLLDSKTLSVVNSWKAYAGSVNEMDVRGDYLLTCGWAQQQYHGLALERLVRVYDLKNQKSIAPVTFGQGAAFVRMHPKLSSTCIVVAQNGAIQSIDVQNPDIPIMRFAQTFDAQLTGLELMPSGKGFAMADTHCQIALWGSTNKIQFTQYTQPTEFADVASPAKHMEWSSDVPLNLIGMPYYREALLSGWSNSLVHEVGAPPAKIDPDVLTALRKFEYGGVGPNLKKNRRYQVERTRGSRDQASLPTPKFLSEQRKDEEGNYEVERRLSEDIGKTLSSLTLNGGPPVYYTPQKMSYSKFGVDDFDFRYFNQTRYSGLEIHIVNSYANPLLQIFRFTNVVRNLALQHIARDCRFENCMLCETGFVVDMLEKASGIICQATNFFKALSKQHNAVGLSFLEEHTFSTPLSIMMQNLTRFLLPTLGENFHRLAQIGEAPNYSRLDCIGRSYSACTTCGYEDSKEQTWYSHDLVYPPRKHAPRNVRHYFSRLVKESVERFDQHRGWCMRCQSYKAIRSRRALLQAPELLMLNAAVHTAEAKQLWSTPGFLPRQIGIIVRNDQFYCYEGQEIQQHLDRQTHDIMVYDLVGMVAEVTTESQQSHLVSMVNTNISEPEPDRRESWHLFNDFMVRPLTSQEALHFDRRWKLPSVITYQAKPMSHYRDDSWKNQIDTSILFRSVTQPAFSPEYECKPLSSADAFPNSNTHYAIDAEFVRLLREEIDMDANGKRAIIRPARTGLARVSVLRGDGPSQELPFVDDYIAIDEPVDDYLTQFSGLHPGDLSVGISRFNLVSLKEVYKKLWVLLNLGVKFIGHGLSSDFRTINIHVPEAQVIDTQILYSLGDRTRRKLSLRFLAWLLLHVDIQANVNSEGHDSIEDARTALKLWRKFLEYESEGVVEQRKDEIFAKGRALDFRVPGKEGSPKKLVLPDTPGGSAPGTPQRRPVSLEMGTPLR